MPIDETTEAGQTVAQPEIGAYAAGWHDADTKYSFRAEPGLSENVIRQISEIKGEPQWMLDFRLRSYEHFLKRPLPRWGGNLGELDFDSIYYYLKPEAENARSWDDVPEAIKDTFEKLGIPEAERTVLAGVGAQYDSETVYHNLQQEWRDKGVVFLDMDGGLREHEDIVKEHFGTVIAPEDNKFSALNSAVWSGGSFVYVPKGVQLEIPLQAYFRINADRAGQFERTLIIVEEGAFVHYIEGCTAPTYASEALHSAVVEIIAKPGARVRYSTVQNWSANVYNLVTKRAVAMEHATVEWLDGNIGSKLTMKYPAVVLAGEGARGEVLSVAYAKDGQHQDTGAKMIHVAPGTSSRIISKSISKGLGRSSYRGLVRVHSGARGAKSNVECDALLLDENSRTDTYPYIEIDEDSASVGHEARVSRVSEQQVFYLMQRGIPEPEAMALVVSGFIEPITKELPLEYAVELNRLIELEMEGSVG
ncbi:Fe-S cluster assembly protein SufB [bacterium]|nr:Fe-S cluster assembly protein SufB [bacterium]